MKSRGLKRIQDPKNNVQFITHDKTIEELQPLVFFDGGKFQREDDGVTIGYHPHSGVGIITYFHGTDLHHKDSGQNHGVLHDGGVQWIRAGGGVWHEEGYRRKQEAISVGAWEGSIHQLWIQLPPEFEESEVDYANLSKEEIPVKENVKVLAGEYKGVKGQLNLPVNMTYLDVQLKKGEEWQWNTPVGQSTGFIFTRDGEVTIDGATLPNSRMGILEHHDGVLKVKAHSEWAAFIIVLAIPNQLPIVARGGQIHTNNVSLERSMNRIREIGMKL